MSCIMLPPVMAQKLAKDCLDGWTLFGCLDGEWKERRICTSGDNAKSKCRAQFWPDCLSGGGRRSTDLDGHGAYVVGTLAPGAHAESYNCQDAYSGHLLPICLSTGQAGAEIGIGIGTTLNCNHEAPIVFDTTQITSKANRSNPQTCDPCHPLAAGAHAPHIAFNLRGRDGGAMPKMAGCASLRSANGGSSRSYVAGPLRSNYRNNSNPTTECSMHIQGDSGVRRLTPLECARLQGFPDDWLDGFEFSDSFKYRALGNAVAVPVVEWIARRVVAAINAGGAS